MTLADWLAKHPYLEPVADLHARLDAALAAIATPAAGLPDWAAYAPDFHAGVPLLESTAAAIDLAPVERTLEPLLAELSKTPLANRRDEPGWQRFLGSMILARYLSSVVHAFGSWRDEERWFRNACPTCGAAPAMAQLIGNDPGRERLLSCGCCRTRWRFQRTQCPFCEGSDARPVVVLEIAGEGGLRIDYCESCRGYLKTYNGTGSEAVMLADWTSLHLDFLARDRGLERRAASLYAL
ncbi:MAG TPA: formate dehydrogenase accessory protein FdhE [Vicinamibacterales bacterium]|nr:formate dehydrogenase accessory protein FdhE [Vicinamibacterales bacterium]